MGLLQGLTEVLPAGSCTSEPATPYLPPCLPPLLSLQEASWRRGTQPALVSPPPACGHSLLSWPMGAQAPPLPGGGSLCASRNLGARSSEYLSLLPCGTPHLLPKGLPAAACFICNRPPSYGHKWSGLCCSVSVVAGFVCLCLLLVSPPSSLPSEPKKPHSCDSGPSLPLWPFPGTLLSTRMWKRCPWACTHSHTHSSTHAHTHPSLILLFWPFLISCFLLFVLSFVLLTLLLPFPAVQVSVSGFLHMGYCGGPASVFVSHSLPPNPPKPSCSVSPVPSCLFLALSVTLQSSSACPPPAAPTPPLQTWPWLHLYTSLWNTPPPPLPLEVLMGGGGPAVLTT